jgi:hypothetical protein
VYARVLSVNLNSKESAYDGMDIALFETAVSETPASNIMWVSSPHAYASSVSLFQMMLRVQNDDTAMVHQLVCPITPHRTLCSYLTYAASISSDAYGIGALAFAHASWSASAASFIIKKEAVKSIGGPAALGSNGNFLGDKLVYLLTKSSWKVYLSKHAVLLDISSVSFSSFLIARVTVIKERLFRDTGRIGVVGEFFFLSPGIAALILIFIGMNTPYNIFMMLCYHILFWGITDLIMSWHIMSSVDQNIELPSSNRMPLPPLDKREIKDKTSDAPLPMRPFIPPLKIKSPKPIINSVMSMPSLESYGGNGTNSPHPLELRGSVSAMNLHHAIVSRSATPDFLAGLSPELMRVDSSNRSGGTEGSGSGSGRGMVDTSIAILNTPPPALDIPPSPGGSRVSPAVSLNNIHTLYAVPDSQTRLSPASSLNNIHAAGSLASIHSLYSGPDVSAPEGFSGGAHNTTANPLSASSAMLHSAVGLDFADIHAVSDDVFDSTMDIEMGGRGASTPTRYGSPKNIIDTSAMSVDTSSPRERVVDIESNLPVVEQDGEQDEKIKFLSSNNSTNKVNRFSVFCSKALRIEFTAIVAWFIWITIIPIIIFSSLVSCVAFSRKRNGATVRLSLEEYPARRAFTVDELLGTAIGLPRFWRFMFIVTLAVAIQTTWYATDAAPSLQHYTEIGMRKIWWSLDKTWFDIKIRLNKPSDLTYWTNHDYYTLFEGEETFFQAAMPYPIPRPPLNGTDEVVNPKEKPTSEMLANRMDWSYFDQIYVVTLTDYRAYDRERLQPTMEILGSLGLTKDKYIVLRTDLDKESGARGCWNSHQSIARHAATAGYQHILVFEDDIQPSYASITPEALATVTSFLKNNEWDVFFFGHLPMQCSIATGVTPEQEYDDYLKTGVSVMKVHSFLTHAYALNGKNIAKLAETDYSGVAVDNGFFFPLEKSYAPYPMWFYQRPILSTLAKSAGVNHMTTAKFLTGAEDTVCKAGGSFGSYMIWYYLLDASALYILLTREVYTRVIENNTAWMFWLGYVILIGSLEVFSFATIAQSIDRDAVICARITRNHIFLLQAIQVVVVLYFIIQTGGLLTAIYIRITALVLLIIFRLATVSCLIPYRLKRAGSNYPSVAGDEDYRHRRITMPNEEDVNVSIQMQDGPIRRRTIKTFSESRDVSD